MSLIFSTEITTNYHNIIFFNVLIGLGVEERILIFCTAENAQRLAEHDDQAGDGMHGELAKIYEQLHSIHTDAYGVLNPELFAILPRKTKLIYIRYLMILKNVVNI